MAPSVTKISSRQQSDNLDVMRELRLGAITLGHKTRKLSANLRAHLDPDLVAG